MNWIEIIGIVATLFVLFSMCCKVQIFKYCVLMRILNIVGSIVFVIYGILLPAVSTAILNGLLVIVNTYHLIILLKSNKK